jgi:hypothetical protein
VIRTNLDGETNGGKLRTSEWPVMAAGGNISVLCRIINL